MKTMRFIVFLCMVSLLTYAPLDAASKAKRGVLVSEVVKGGPADKAGLCTGDLVVEVNGRKIKDSRQLLLLISSLPVGEKVNLKVLRESRIMFFRPVLAERKD